MNAPLNLPPLPGSYVLVLRLPREQVIQVGQLGRFPFPAGYYLYVGSARGPGGLRARLSRHLREKKRTHWHVDYLQRRTHPVEIWYALSSRPLECAWRAILQDTAPLSLPVPGFGASDCRCPAHLLYTAKWPDAALWQVLAKTSGAPLQRVVLKKTA